MVGASKILTVSYGTFSCTLEGFDDPFSTMRSIAEYFRDLAADDRYFGAEPPTPDAEMLQRIAEQEIQRRVEARVQDNNNLVLTQMDDEPAETETSADMMSSDFTPTAFAPSYEDEVDVAGEDLPQAADTAELDDAATAETVAEKLSRIRAVVDSARAEEKAEPEDTVEDVVQDLAETTEDEDDTFDEDATEDEIAEAMSAFDTDPADTDDEFSEPLIAESNAEPPIEKDDEVTAETPELEAFAEDDLEDDISWDKAEAFSDDDFEDAFDEPETAEDDDDGVEMSDENDAEEDDQVEPIGRVVTLSGFEFEDDKEEETDDAVSEEAPKSEDDWGFGEEDDEEDLDDLAALDGAESPASDWSDMDDDDDDDGWDLDEPAEAEVDDDFDLEDDEVVVAEVEVEDDNDEVAAELDEDEVEGEDDDVAASIRAALGDADMDDDDVDDEAVAERDDVDLDSPDDHEDALAAGAMAARERLADLTEDEEETTDVDRLMEKTNNQMEESEGSRRRSAIAHLKAAVAATKADRLLKRVTAREKDDEEEQTQYRDDLAQVVRPKRPDAHEASSERPTPMGEAASPLMLVSELRVDEDGEETSASPIRPRRVSAEEALEAENSGYEDGASFADFAEKMGAKELPDLLEAAAAYAAFVENQPHFSRPQLMKRVARHDQSGEFSREAGLRSFGQLLRQGKIRKLKRGQFTVADTTRFNPDARIAGE